MVENMERRGEIATFRGQEGEKCGWSFRRRSTRMWHHMAKQESVSKKE